MWEQTLSKYISKQSYLITSHLIIRITKMSWKIQFSMSLTLCEIVYSFWYKDIYIDNKKVIMKDIVDPCAGPCVDNLLDRYLKLWVQLSHSHHDS